MAEFSKKTGIYREKERGEKEEEKERRGEGERSNIAPLI